MEGKGGGSELLSTQEPGGPEPSAGLVEWGKSRGYVTLDEICRALAGVEHDLEAYVTQGDDLFRRLHNAGVQVVEAEGDEKAAEVEAHSASKGDTVRSASDLERVPIDDGVGLYFAEVRQVPLLMHEEEVALAVLMEEGRAAAEALSLDGHTPPETKRLQSTVRRGAEARECLIRANTRLVISVAKRYQGMGLPLLDLVQAGNIGLIRAADKYDYRRGTKFSTLATWWIRQAVARSVSKQGRTIRLPVHMGGEIRILHRTAQRLAQALGTEPSPEEIATSLGNVSADHVRWMLRMSRQPLSLESPIGEDGDDELGSLIEDTTSMSPTDTAERDLLRDEMAAMLDGLPPREVRAVRMRFGLDGGRPLSLKEIGDRMGVTRERARQIIVQALRRLRHPRRSRHLVRYLR